MRQFREREEQKPKTGIAFQKGNDLVTGKAWNAWVTDGKDINMIDEKRKVTRGHKPYLNPMRISRIRWKG